MRRENRIKRLAEEMATAKSKLIKNRIRLAAATKPSDPHVIFSRESKPIARVMERRAALLRSFDNVLGYTVGKTIRKGMILDEPCITVFVRKKIPVGKMREKGIQLLPRIVKEGKRRVRIDVVEIGELKRHAFGGDSIGPENGAYTGTLGARAEDQEGQGPVAITAMHVSGASEHAGAGAGVVFTSPSRREDSSSPPFGVLTMGTMTGIDAAKIKPFEPGSLEPRILGIGRVSGWRPLVVPVDEGTSVRMYGAASGFQVGSIVHPFVALPEYNLDAAILVKIFSEEGDSGAALVDPQNLILGFLVGEAGSSHDHLRVFTPAGLVLKRLACDIPTF
jgi:hypothetical protein